MKISIITVCYNSENTIEDTIQSVLSQTYLDYEYYIIDGLSRDLTLKIARKYEKSFQGKLKIVSEQDKGLYDAMNKGIKKAKGDIIGFINSDDVLANPFVFEKIVTCFQKTHCDGVYGDLVFLDKDTMTIPTRNFIAHRCSKHFGWHPPHPTFYVKKEIYQDIGFFNTDYKIAADLDIMLRIIRCGHYHLEYIPEYLVKMRDGGVSTNGFRGYLKNLKEANLVLKNNHVHCVYLINFYRILKTIMQGFSAKVKKRKIMKNLDCKEV